MQIRITRRRTVVLCLAVLVVAGAFFWDHMVVTEEERIETVIEEAALALERNDLDTCLTYLDEDCRLMGRPVKSLRKLLEEAIRSYPLREADPYGIDVTLDEENPNRARAKVVSAVILRDYGEERKIDWKLELVRHDDHNWRLTNITPYFHKSREQIFLTQLEWLLR